jgi:hypothetical protein
MLLSVSRGVKFGVDAVRAAEPIQLASLRHLLIWLIRDVFPDRGSAGRRSRGITSFAVADGV